MQQPGSHSGEGTSSTGERNSARLGPGKGGARRKRTTYTKEQLKILKTAFHENDKPGIAMREHLSTITKVPEDRIQVWFQNRRARQQCPRRKENCCMSNQRTCNQPCYPQACPSGAQKQQLHNEQNSDRGAPVCLPQTPYTVPDYHFNVHGVLNNDLQGSRRQVAHFTPQDVFQCVPSLVPQNINSSDRDRGAPSLQATDELKLEDILDELLAKWVD